MTEYIECQTCHVGYPTQIAYMTHDCPGYSLSDFCRCGRLSLRNALLSIDEGIITAVHAECEKPFADFGNEDFSTEQEVEVSLMLSETGHITIKGW